MDDHERDETPATAELVAEFVNTRQLPGSFDGGRQVREELSTPSALARWFQKRGLLAAGATVSEAELRWAIEVREALRELLEANNGLPARSAGVETLNRAARGAHVQLTFRPDGRAALVAYASGVDAALGRLLAAAAASQAEGGWERLKACRNEDCLWAFYDHSKNRSATWCCTNCGNLMKARAYRRRRAARHKEAAHDIATNQTDLPGSRDPTAHS